MNELDIAILVIAILGAIQGIFKGFIVSLASLLALVLGYYLSIRFAWYFEKLLTDATGSNSLLIHVLSFVVCFTVVVIGVHLLGRVIQKAFELTPLGCINRIMGALFGLFKGLLLVSALIYIIEVANVQGKIINKTSKDQSILYYPIAKLLPSLIPHVKEMFEKKETSNTDTETPNPI